MALESAAQVVARHLGMSSQNSDFAFLVANSASLFVEKELDAFAMER
jgi:hypothetical protein